MLRSSDPSLGNHFTVPFDRLVATSQTKAAMVSRVQRMESLDGSGMMWLALNEACEFSVRSGEENVLVLVSDTEWDSDGLATSVDSIVNSVKVKFSRIYAANGEVNMPKAKNDANFVLKRVSQNLFFFDDSTMTSQLTSLARKIKRDYDL